MKNEVFELHQNVGPKERPLIYRFDVEDGCTFVRLLQTDSRKFSEPIMMGLVQKHNNRGWTITGYSLAPRPITFFLSNTEFTRVNV